VNTPRVPFNWDAAMAFGLGVLKLAPCDFWAMTPRELDAALAGHYGRGRFRRGPSRSELDDLMAEYPDNDDSDEGVRSNP